MQAPNSPNASFDCHQALRSLITIAHNILQRVKRNGIGFIEYYQSQTLSIIDSYSKFTLW